MYYKSLCTSAASYEYTKFKQCTVRVHFQIANCTTVRAHMHTCTSALALQAAASSYHRRFSGVPWHARTGWRPPARYQRSNRVHYDVSSPTTTRQRWQRCARPIVVVSVAAIVIIVVDVGMRCYWLRQSYVIVLVSRRAHLRAGGAQRCVCSHTAAGVLVMTS